MSDLARVQAQLEAVQAELRDLRTRERASAALGAAMLDLPALVGAWMPTSVQRSTGNVYDLSGQARTLTYNGNPTLNHYNGLVPYYDLDGTGDFFSRADEADMRVTGAETIYASAVRGLTMGGWFWLDTATYAQTRGFVSKDNIAAARAYGLFVTAAGAVQAFVSSDGSAQTLATGATLTASQWYFLWGRFLPSTYLDAGVGVSYTRNTTSIPASIFAATSVFNVGSVNSDGVNRVIDGRWAAAFVCANALSDNLLGAFYQRTRALFGQ